MPRVTTKGKCGFCGAEFSKGGIGKHLDTCTARLAQEAAKASKGQPAPIFHLAVEGADAPDYWMHLDVPAKTTLATLDGFLRDTWLECCGHMSAFDIGGQKYSQTPMAEMGDKSARVALEKVASVGTRFGYEYDFGTTTPLTLRVVSAHTGTDKSVHILARNEPPHIGCDTCGKEATDVCTQCIYEDAGWLCESCAEKHECGEEMLLPVVNSPRVGQCAYSGDD